MNPNQQQSGKFPSREQLEYAKLALELLLLVIAIPYILRQFGRDPAGLSRQAAAKHLKG